MIIEQTQAWIKQIVVAHGFCPFAARELERESVAYHLLEGKDISFFLEKLLECCQELDTQPDIETSFLIFAEAFPNFEDYLDVLDLAEELLEIQHYAGVYQLASFHPNYTFEGEKEEDAANFTNRSPYPMWHLLREASVEKAITSHSDAEGIPEKNIRLARRKGKDYFQNILNKILNRP